MDHDRPSSVRLHDVGSQSALDRTDPHRVECAGQLRALVDRGVSAQRQGLSGRLRESVASVVVARG
jgi:hypothetical protein